jgi:hypothetical protein
VKQNFRTISNRRKLSIFTTIPPYTSKKISPFFKYLKENKNISFSEFLNSLNLDENAYILSLKSKLTKAHFFNT